MNFNVESKRHKYQHGEEIRERQLNGDMSTKTVVLVVFQTDRKSLHSSNIC